MITTTKALIAFCVLAVVGTVLVIGPDGLRRLLPGAPQSEVASTKTAPARMDTKAEPGMAEARPAAAVESKPGSRPEGAATASSAPVAPAQPAKQDSKQDSKPDPLTETRQATAALADLVPPRAPPASETGPRFDVARIDPDGVAVIAGRAAPGARVELLRGGETLDSAVADSGGQFVMTPQKLPSGQYELTLRAKTPDGAVTQSSRGVAVALSEPAPRLAAATSDVVLPKNAEKNAAKTTEKTADKPAETTKDQSKDASALSANAAPTPAAATEATTGTIGLIDASRTVSRGDSLWALSRRAYGDGARYARIYNANRDKIHNPNLIYPGQTFVMPKQ
jgi:nucleoid-associated protein YgaU